MRWYLLVIALAVAALLVFRRRTGRPAVRVLVILAFLGIMQAALEVPFPVDLVIIVAAGIFLLSLFKDYFRVG
ncbi:MAG: hypothetical protein ACRDJP_08345 [Actinomycetota bacterium]